MQVQCSLQRNPDSLKVSMLLYLATLLAFTTTLTAAEEKAYESLKESSPFLPSGFNSKSIATSASKEKEAVFLFKGYVKIGEDQLFGIEDTANKKTFWVKKGETGKPVTIESFDLDKKELVFTSNGEKIVANMKAPDAMKTVAHKRPVITTLRPTPSRVSTTKTAGNRPPVRRIIPRRTIKRTMPSKPGSTPSQ
jgi:hypothetical protein